MKNVAPMERKEIPEHLRPAMYAFERAVKNAFLTGQAYDPDGKGYAYWKAQEETERLPAELNSE